MNCAHSFDNAQRICVLTWLWFWKAIVDKIEYGWYYNYIQNAERRVCTNLILLPTARFAPFDVVLVPHREDRYDNAEHANHREEREIERNIRPIQAENT